MSTSARPRVLLTGGSIAGPTLAWGLHRAGFAVTVLERSPARRDAGQNIDVRGLGREVLRRTGLQDAVMARLTGEVGTRFVDEAGRVVAEVTATAGRDGTTAEVEILRGDLSALLLDAVDGDVEVRYGDAVTSVDQDATGVDVTTASGARERYDLLLVAEGRSSRTRRHLFADRTRVVDKGVNIAYGTIDREEQDDDWWYWMTTSGRRTVSVRPDPLGTLRASLNFMTPDVGFDGLPVAAQLQVLRARFGDVGWRVQRVLEGFAQRPEEFYTERMAQVVVSRWSTGRVALVGDAAWGSGPTGMGTTLSLVGAHVLAGELGRTLSESGVTHGEAFARYERLLRRYVDSAQGLPPGTPGLMHPRSDRGVRVLHRGMRIALAPALRRFAEKTVITSQRHEPALPEYPGLRG
ncbi:FAD-dependent monooxygenase [Kineococcus rubinsiae]|uniref:FAD-dependent monooxygenase n=1 Tax=Kineococcus rubinsiae TaxID=2609562 RepID=UPI001430C410|nr:FAD-dependent monooxygenase [Kineococcus rubinsiae]NIZ91249.1 monooxygenase [Kineococcus rubinsiae]